VIRVHPRRMARSDLVWSHAPHSAPKPCPLPDF
jgi:hypothetical protein